MLDAMIGMAIPLLFRSIIDKGILAGNDPVIFRLTVLLVLLGVLSALFSLAQAYLSSQIGARLLLLLRTRVFEHLQRMPLAFFTQVQTGAIVSRLDGDIASAQSSFTDVLYNVIGNGTSVLLIGGAMLSLSWRLSIGIVSLLPIFVVSARIWGRKLSRITREAYNLAAEMDSFVVERFNVGGVQLTKLFGRKNEESAEFGRRAKALSHNSVQRALYGRLFWAVLVLMVTFATAFVYGWGGHLVAKRALDVGTIVAFASYLGRLYSPLTGLTQLQGSILTALVSFDRVFGVLDLAPAIQQVSAPVDIPPGPAGLSFNHVTFRYPVRSEVLVGSFDTAKEHDDSLERIALNDITFTAHPGQLIAIVGRSGSGKSTIARLAARLYDVNSGSVTVRGVDIRSISLNNLSRCVGLLTQESHLFHDTIRANLMYANPRATQDQLENALASAQILPLIKSLPNGLDTFVGQQGHQFSGGEKQRLAIARLILKAPDIVILDEPTAHLDPACEAAMQVALDVALQGRTRIIIAHSLSSIINADLILVMEEGRILERGTHAGLFERDGVYAALFRQQLPGFEFRTGAGTTFN